MLISLLIEKAFDKIRHPFLIKIFTKPRNQGNFLSLINGLYKKK